MTLQLDALPAPDPSRRPLRIAILGSRGIPARYGGFEAFADELSWRLVERGAEVTVFCQRGPRPAATRLRGVRLEHVPAWAPGPLRPIAYDLQCLWRARRGFDLVYMLGYGAAFACFLPRLSGTEVWVNMDGLEWRRTKWGLLGRRWLKTMEGLACLTADHLVFDNAAVAREVCSRRRIPRYSVLEYGAPVVHDVDSAPLEDYGLTPGEYYLAVCRCEPENHLLEIVRAHDKAAAGRPLVIVTPRLDTAYCRELLAWESERVRLPGAIYDPQVLRPLRRHCRAYLHGHSVGGTNPSLLEAMGCGNLVIAHDNPFNRETLGEAGLFFPDEHALQRRLEAVERLSAAELGAYGEQARERAAGRYSWERIADRYCDAMGQGLRDVRVPA